jgi:hypothetical protein
MPQVLVGITIDDDLPIGISVEIEIFNTGNRHDETGGNQASANHNVHFKSRQTRARCGATKRPSKIADESDEYETVFDPHRCKGRHRLALKDPRLDAFPVSEGTAANEQPQRGASQPGR